jgi:hypothetical protein
MSGDGLASATRFLVLALSILYGLAAVVGLVLLDFGTAGLVSVGAAVGGVPLVWTLIVPTAVAAVIACTIALARRPTSAPA